jgi:DNA-binding LacI/PurR family transcriptional regulator
MEFADPSYARLVDGIASGASEKNYHLLLAKLTGNESSIMELPPILRDSRVDGILVSGEITSGVMDVLRQMETPIVILGTYHESITRDNSVVLLSMRSMYARTVEYLKSQGKTRIAFFNETMEWYS